MAVEKLVSSDFGIIHLSITYGN